MASKKSGRAFEKKPLYRKVNTKTHGVRHHSRGAYADSRGTEATKTSDTTRGPMNAKNRNGLDYTPLFRFLLSKVGCDWDVVHSEAVGRLDREEPIFWIVARNDSELMPIVRLGEASYYSGLFVDKENLLQVVDPSIVIDQLRPICSCCTHTFNAVPFTRTDVEEHPNDSSFVSLWRHF